MNLSGHRPPSRIPPAVVGQAQSKLGESLWLLTVRKDSSRQRQIKFGESLWSPTPRKDSDQSKRRNKLVPINRTRIFSEKMYGFDLTSGQTFVSDRLKMLNISSYSGQTSA